VQKSEIRKISREIPIYPESKQMKKYFLPSMKFIAVLAAVVVFGGQLLGQSSTTGGINGKVIDPQGAVLPNATVKLTNLGTQAERTVTTTGEGVFDFPNLQPATYRIDVTASGFSSASVAQVIVEVGHSTPVDVNLAIGQASGNVIVTAEAPVINTEDNANATNITTTEIEELPINGRRASDFVRLTPGVNPEGEFGLNSFRGLSSLLNNHQLDGTDNNDTFFSEERGRTRIQYSVSQASVQEFQVNNTNFSAEYGRAAGGVVNTITKSGTNDLSGEAFFFDRDNKWGARNPSATLPGPGGTSVAVKPKDVRYQFGIGVGGKIIKDKLFWFFTFDQQKRNFPGVATPQFPAAFNPITVTPGSTLATRGVTQAQADAGIAFLTGLTGVAPRRQDQRIFFPKIDWKINANNQLTFSYNRVRTNGLNAFQTPSVLNIGLADFGDDLVSIDTFNARLTSSIGTNMINEFRFQRGRENARSILQTETDSEKALAGKGATLNGLLPSVSFNSSANAGFQFGTSTNFQRGAFPDEYTTQFADTFTYIVGNHQVKFGGDLKFTRDFISNLRTEYGAYTYNSVADFISDYTSAVNATGLKCGTVAIPRACYSTFQQGLGLRDYTLKTPDYAAFVQDNWRMMPRLTVNFGVRWDLQGMPKPLLPNMTAAVLNTNTTVIPQRYTQDQANAVIARTGTFPTDKNNFGPRVGFAWDVFGNGQTVVRGGWGLYYGRVPNTFLSSAVSNSGAAGSQVALTSITPSTAGAPIFPSVLTAGVGATTPPSITTINPKFENPEVNEVDLIFERQIAKNTAFSFSYLYTKATKLPAFIDQNLGPATQARTYTISGGPQNGTTFTVPFIASYLNSNTGGNFTRPIVNFGSIIDMESIGKSNYWGLVFQLQRRMTNGLAVQASYTHSKAIDYDQQFATFAANFMTVSFPYDISFDKGPSGNNIPDKFVASAVWRPGQFFGIDKHGVGRAILRDFQLSPIFNIGSGYALGASIPTTFPPSFSSPSNGLFGAGGSLYIPFLRNVNRRPYTWTTDLRLSKRIRFSEHRNLELLAEGFNIFNRGNVGGSGAVNTSYIQTASYTATGGTLIYNPSYGTVSATGVNNSAIFAPRQIQLGVRFSF
jgi:hypothetical protein